jgi:hypothetical protein
MVVAPVGTFAMIAGLWARVMVAIVRALRRTNVTVVGLMLWMKLWRGTVPGLITEIVMATIAWLEPRGGMRCAVTRFDHMPSTLRRSMPMAAIIVAKVARRRSVLRKIPRPRSIMPLRATALRAVRWTIGFPTFGPVMGIATLVISGIRAPLGPATMLSFARSRCIRTWPTFAADVPGRTVASIAIADSLGPTLAFLQRIRPAMFDTRAFAWRTR